MKLSPRKKFDLLSQTFHSEIIRLKLSSNLSLILVKEFKGGLARESSRNSEIFQRVYLPIWTLNEDKDFAIAMHYLLHELTHFQVGIKEQHNLKFKKAERENHKFYGYFLSSYIQKDKYGKEAYSYYIWEEQTNKRSWLFGTKEFPVPIHHSIPIKDF